MKMTRFFCLVVCFICGLQTLLHAQGVYEFKEGLELKGVHRYGREALYTDHLAWQLYKGLLSQPQPESVFKIDNSPENLRWAKVSADTSGKFGGRGYWGSGYLYLSYNSDKEQSAVLNIRGNSAVFVNKELRFGDPYDAGWMYIPVKLKKGLNELYVRGQHVKASLTFPGKSVFMKADDATLPDIVAGNDNKSLKGAIVIVNMTSEVLKNLRAKSSVAGKIVFSDLPEVPALSTRKVIFELNAQNISDKGKINCDIELFGKGKLLDDVQIQVESVSQTDKYRTTYISDIDGSLQYFAVTPQIGGTAKNSALFFSVHGAGVEAISQARAYKPKDWGTLVAPTNRRPRGFNWEDWGRLDALEVLNIAKKKFEPDPQRVYLTGHSMGGHGTWFLGATYPGTWAAIAPCAGYPTLKGYGSADGLIPDSSSSDVERMLLRASNQSDVIKLATNYKPLGVYILHGDADPVVSVKYARQMKSILAGFHSDFSYYEYPGGNHWYGDESVDWDPLFGFFKSHKRPVDSAVNTIDFITSNPGVSSTFRWASILQQQHPLNYSRIVLERDKSAGKISGFAENVEMLLLNLKDFGAARSVSIRLDSLQILTYTTKSNNDSIFLKKKADGWSLSAEPLSSQKNPHRYGTLKEAFGKQMVFVYGTKGNNDENAWSAMKAKYDAEAWYYRGNGAVDVIADKNYSAKKYAGRNVIIYGNANTNSAYAELLKDSPVQVMRNTVKVGNKIYKGGDLGAYFMWPIKGTSLNSVAVIGGSGIDGMNAASANQYFAGGSGFPDFMVFSLDMLISGEQGVKATGFYDNDWKIGPDIVRK